MKIRSDKRGFTLIDTVLGITIISIILPTLLVLTNDMNIKSISNESVNKGTAYANTIINYIIGHRFDENYNTIGAPWTYPLGQDYGDHDDIDDFIGMDWSIIPGYAEAGYQASSNVFYIDDSVDLLTNCFYATNYKRIVVTVTHPTLQNPIILTTLMTPHGN